MLENNQKIEMKDAIAFARVGRPHGLKGGFFLKTEDNRSEWNHYPFVWLETPSGLEKKKVIQHYVVGKNKALVILLEGLSNREAIEPLYLYRLLVEKKDIPLKQDEFLVSDLMDFAVMAEGKGLIGHIKGVTAFGAQDNLVIQKKDSEETSFFPFMDRFIQKIDHAEKQIWIEYIDVFFENN